LKTHSPKDTAQALRAGKTPVVARIEQGIVWLDPRTMEPDEVEIVAQRLQGLVPK
jgi:seryl-tRNA(Sec) selenium transferase